MAAPRLLIEYKERIVPALMKQFSYKSIMQVPFLEKICLSRGVGEATQDKKSTGPCRRRIYTYRRPEAGYYKVQKRHLELQTQD